MRRLAQTSLFLFLAAWILSCTPSVSEITEDDVRIIMDEVQTATNKKDIEGVMKHLAPEVIINVTTDASFGQQRMRLSRNEYEAQTRQAWSLASAYEYRRENESIELSEDRQTATVKTEVIETMVVRGQRIRTRTHETATIEIVDGTILVTVLEAVVVKE